MEDVIVAEVDHDQRNSLSRIRLPTTTCLSTFTWKDVYNTCLCTNDYAILVDCRESGEFEEKTVATAINIPPEHSTQPEQDVSSFSIEMIERSSFGNERLQRSFKFRSGKTVIIFDNDGGAYDNLADTAEEALFRWRDHLAQLFFQEGKVSRIYVVNQPLVKFWELFPFVANPLPESKYPNQILDYLYLGNYQAAVNKEMMKEMGITHVVNACREVATCRNAHASSLEIAYMNIVVQDTASANIAEKFECTYEFIESGIDKLGSNARFLVHCYAGVSRSASLVIAYLMKKQNMRLREAFNFTFCCRSAICPNEGFRMQLLCYEKTLFGNISMSQTEVLELGNYYAKANFKNGCTDGPGLSISEVEANQNRHVGRRQNCCMLM